MMQDGWVKHLQRRTAIGISIRLHFFAAVLLLGSFGALPVFGNATYSDTWADDSEVPPDTIYEEGAVRGGPYAVGSGVTDGAYTHEYYVDTKITSPSGRSASESSSPAIGFARSDALLLWVWDDAGDHLIESRHWGRCPYDVEGFYYAVGLSRAILPFGASINVMFHQTGTNNPSVYRAIPNCSVECPVTGYIRRDHAGTYVWLIVPKGPFGCLKGSIVRRFAPNAQCFDVF